MHPWSLVDVGEMTQIPHMNLRVVRVIVDRRTTPTGTKTCPNLSSRRTTWQPRTVPLVHMEAAHGSRSAESSTTHSRSYTFLYHTVTQLHTPLPHSYTVTHICWKPALCTDRAQLHVPDSWRLLSGTRRAGLVFWTNARRGDVAWSGASSAHGTWP